MVCWYSLHSDSVFFCSHHYLICDSLGELIFGTFFYSTLLLPFYFQFFLLLKQQIGMFSLKISFYELYFSRADSLVGIVRKINCELSFISVLTLWQVKGEKSRSAFSKENQFVIFEFQFFKFFQTVRFDLCNISQLAFILGMYVIPYFC